VVDVNLALTAQSWGNLTRALRARLGRQVTVAAFHEAVVDELFGVKPGAALRGDKTPDYGFYMGLLQRLWPQTRFVHVVRNGIDTARSMSLHPGCQLMISAGFDNWVPLCFDGEYQRYKRLDLPLRAYVGSWRRRMARIREEATMLKNDTYLEVRYETLIVEPATVLKAVATHLELELDQAWLDHCSKLVRPRVVSGQVSIEVLRDFTLEDLKALNEVGCVPFFLFPPDAGVGWLQSALEKAVAKPRDAGAGDAIQVAIGVLATHAGTEVPYLRSRALTLLREIVTLRGDDPRRWLVLMREETLAC
jgi:hypothetical protein